MAAGWNGDIVMRNLVDSSQTTLSLDAPEVDLAAYSPDRHLFAIASSMGFARVWNTSTWKPVATLGSFLNGVHGVNFSPDGKRLIIASHGKEAVRLCDTESWQDVLTLEAGAGFASTAFSPDGKSLVWGVQNSLSIWRAPTLAEIHAAEAKEKAKVQQQ
jgi:WD40 repeat protein